MLKTSIPEILGTILVMITLSQLYKRDKAICHICGERVQRLSDATRDHIVPKALGGKTGRGSTNIALAHRWCNKRKGNRVFRAEQHSNGYVVVDPKGQIVSDVYVTSIEASIIAEEMNQDRIYMDDHYEEAIEIVEDSDILVLKRVQDYSM